MVTCVKCSKAAGEEDHFCSGCGAKLETSQIADLRDIQKEAREKKNNERLDKLALFLFVLGWVFVFIGLWRE